MTIKGRPFKVVYPSNFEKSITQHKIFVNGEDISFCILKTELVWDGNINAPRLILHIAPSRIEIETEETS